MRPWFSYASPLAFYKDPQKLLIFAFGLIPAIGIIAPRAMAFLPGLAALIIMIAVRPALCGSLSLRRFVSWPFSLMACACFTLCAASTLWAYDPVLSFNRALGLAPVLMMAVLFFSLAKHFSSTTSQELLRSIIYLLPRIGIILICWMGVLFLARIIDTQSYNEVFFVDVNLSDLNRSIIVFSIFLLAALGTLGLESKALIAKAHIIPRLLFIALFIFVMTDSQSAQLGLMAGLFFLYVFPAARPWAWLLLRGVLAVLMLAAPYIAQWLYTYLSADAADVLWLREAYAASRMEIWDFIARKALESPWLGHGIEATRAMHFQHAQHFHHTDTVLHPHNFALQIWIEFGLLGASLTVLFFDFLLRKMSALPLPLARLGLGLLFAALSMAATGYGLWQGWWVGLLGFLPSLLLIAKKAYDSKPLLESA